MIKAKFWGTRGSIATPGKKTARYGGNTSCVEVRADGQLFVFDAGTGIRELGLRLEKEFRSKPLTVHIFISHTHWDHIQGFPFFLPAYEDKNQIFVYGPAGRDKSLDEILRIQMDSDYFPVELGDMKARISVKEIHDRFTIGGMTVEPFYLNHPAMTFGYRLSNRKQTVIYATDNEPYRYSLHQRPNVAVEKSDYPDYLDQKFVDFLSQADLLIGEAQYTLKEYESKKGWGHSPIESMVEFAWRARVKQLVLFHHDPLHDDKTVDRMVKHAQRLARARGGNMKCIGAYEGMEIVVGKSGKK
ncbi:MAG: MBL fold metallo-hydrolase [Ignavibacteriales bacterium]|nr:MBL fold metallo-hydrolase [Ignavibacteriales bacterium]